MKNVLAAIVLMLMAVGPSPALEVAGTTLDQSVTVQGQTLKLNGYGIRKKLFIKVYIGALYSAHRLSTAAEAFQDRGAKLIRMNFLHSKLEKGKIIAAFSEGFAGNSPELAGSADVQRFLALFTADFMRGDVVDLKLGADGSVSASHNGRLLGTISSAKLARAVLAIYLGDKPADESLKAGLLGM